MGEFEKWWNKYAYGVEPREKGLPREIAKDAYNQGKKAALELVLSKEMVIDADSGNWRGKHPIVYVKDIGEELKKLEDET